MNKTEFLRDAGIIGVLWASVVLVIFALPDVPVATKYLLVILVSLGTTLAFPIYFGWEKIRARPSFYIALAAGILTIGLLLAMAVVLDEIVYYAWNWFSINGVFVVTWLDVLATVLLLLSVFMYYVSVRTAMSLMEEARKHDKHRARINP